MEQVKKQRLFYLDFVRVVALFSILVIHFNASVTGYFAYPSRLFGSILPFGIYLGDFGSTLFFMVSGSALAYTSKPGTSPFVFYKKRAVAVYPMFWLAWLGAFSVRFVERPGFFAGVKSPTLVLTLLGVDNFAVAAGWVSRDFAIVGEWFLGSILFIYILFPLLKWGLDKNPITTVAAVSAICIPVHLLGWDSHLVAIHVVEFLFGVLFVRFGLRERVVAGVATVALLVLLQHCDTKVLSALFGALIFILLVFFAEMIDCVPLRKICSLISKYSYAVFLIHHVIILRMVEGFDLASITRRDTALLFAVYLLFVAAAAFGLFQTDRYLRANFCQWIKSD